MSPSHYKPDNPSSQSQSSPSDRDQVQVQEVPILITTPPVQLPNPPLTRTRKTPSHEMSARLSLSPHRSFSGSGSGSIGDRHHLYPQPSPNNLNSPRRGNFVSRSPIRDLFRSSRTPTSAGFLSPSIPLSPSISTSIPPENRAGVAFDIHLYDFGTHSELAFEPAVSSSPRSPSSASNDIPLTPLPRRVSTSGDSPLSPSMAMPMTSYRVALEHFDIEENIVVLVCRDDQKNKIANLQTSPRGTEIISNYGTEDDGYSSVSISMVEKGQGQGTGMGYRLYLTDQILEWTESTGLAILFDSKTRRPLAKLNYRIFGKDRLVIVGRRGMENLPLILSSAAKMWFEHQNGKHFRL